ncbi:carboxypeptidase regulatory-like domain-containing protein [Lysobacter sp. 1R34A]|uniref:carboxypeptidase regulatory-like domain-containing protein n=1 Tax=Lysobacter sp. 1R34A TaxID=3445786 RepID=UPI003EEB5214
MIGVVDLDTGVQVGLETLIAAVLGAAAVLGMACLIWRQYRGGAGARARGWRLGVLLIAQPLMAALLYLALLPPQIHDEPGTLVVATAGASANDGAAAGEHQVALPEARTVGDSARVPDLATALRRHPGTHKLRLLGAGLEPRDRDAARGLTIEWRAPALPHGFTGLWAPREVAAGGEFEASGRVEAVPGAVVELLDPGLQRVDRYPLAADGGFRVGAVARLPGTATFRLRLRDARQNIVEEIELPLSVIADPPPRVLILAGAPNPELKYLRRWGADAGIKLHTQIEAGAGLQLGDAPLSLNASTLAGFDLVVLDERVWDRLGESQRGALLGAMRDGLGVLLRIGGPLSPRARAQLRALGFELGAGADSLDMRVPPISADEAATRARIGPGTREAPRLRDEALAELPVLSRRAISIEAAGAHSLLRGADGQAFATWRNAGRGRLGLWTLSDSFRLTLAGRDDLHGQWWSAAFAALARPQPKPMLRIEGEARQDRRIVLCGLSDGALVRTPQGRDIALLIDPASGSERCAGFWPTDPGWHALRQGERSQPFAVRGRDEAPGLRASELREATLQLMAQAQQLPLEAASSSAGAASARAQRGASWPWFLAWLFVSAGVWWLERSRRGRMSVPAQVVAGSP